MPKGALTNTTTIIPIYYPYICKCGFLCNLFPHFLSQHSTITGPIPYLLFFLSKWVWRSDGSRFNKNQLFAITLTNKKKIRYGQGFTTQWGACTSHYSCDTGQHRELANVPITHWIHCSFFQKTYWKCNTSCNTPVSPPYMHWVMFR